MRETQSHFLCYNTVSPLFALQIPALDKHELDFVTWKSIVPLEKVNGLLRPVDYVSIHFYEEILVNKYIAHILLGDIFLSRYWISCSVLLLHSNLCSFPKIIYNHLPNK